MKGQCLIQSIMGTFLYYARAIDDVALPALNNIGTQQSKPTKNTIKDRSWLMDYFHTYPNMCLRFFVGNMQLPVDSDVAYLVMPGTKSRFPGYFYMVSNPHPLNYNGVPHNAPILVECHTLKNIVCSAAEAECGGLFHNAQNAMTIQIILEALGHL
eukprot:10773390-Ditylum_brightwellii.AAC.1